MAAVHANGLMSPPQTEKAVSVASPPRVVLAGKTGRILCVADIRGDCKSDWVSRGVLLTRDPVGAQTMNSIDLSENMTLLLSFTRETLGSSMPRAWIEWGTSEWADGPPILLPSLHCLEWRQLGLVISRSQ